MEKDILMGLIWILSTLAVVTASAFLAKSRGVSVLIATYTGLVIISITTATKIITFMGVTVPAGVIVYSASFLITDMIAEVYGKEKAQTAVWVGFFGMILFFLYSAITVKWPGAAFWTMQKSYEDVMGLSGRVALGGAIAFIVSQFSDVSIFHYLRSKHGDKKLYLRNNISTWISQLLDTTVFISIAFYGVFPIAQLILFQYMAKVLIALLDTPFLYVSRRILKSSKLEI